MNSKLENYLYEKYPEIFKNHTKSMQETCMCWGCSCGDGWLILLDRLCSQIQSHIKNQHKEVEMYEQWEKKDIVEGMPSEPRPEWAKEKIPQVHFEQVKEKFGALRIYIRGGDDEIRHMIDFVESLSRSICEDCGKFDYSVGSSTRGWIHSSCNKCASKKKGYIESSEWGIYEENEDIGKIFEEVLEYNKNQDESRPLNVEKLREIESRTPSINKI